MNSSDNQKTTSHINTQELLDFIRTAMNVCYEARDAGLDTTAMKELQEKERALLDEMWSQICK